MSTAASIDYPAAHSMDTYWFAIDDAGEVAHMETHENGPAPMGERTDGIFGIFDALDKDENGLPIFPVDQDFFPEGLNTKELEKILADFSDSARAVVQKLAFSSSLSEEERRKLKKSVKTDFLNFLVLLVDSVDIKEFELFERDDEIVRLDPIKPIFHIKGSGYVGVDALCLLVKGRLLAWRQVEVDICDPESVADFYGIYTFGSDYSSFTKQSDYLDRFPVTLTVPVMYERERVPKNPRVGLFSKATVEQLASEKPGAYFHRPPWVYYMPGARFSEMKTLQVADFIPCYSWGDGNLLPDSGDSAMRRNLTIIYKADAAERDRHVAAWHEAAEQGDILAQYALFYWCRQDGVVDKDISLYWINEIVDKTEADPPDSFDIFKNGSVAKYILGMIYKAGNGVAQDEVMAKFWLERSASGGCHEAMTALKDFPSA